MTGRKPAKVKLCDACRIDNGWHYPDDGEPYRCPNLLTPALRDAEAERDAGIDAAGNADPAAKLRAVEIVRDAAVVLPELSANDVREVFDREGLRRTLIAGALKRAKANGWIRVCGQVISGDPGTHKKPIDQHESLIFRAEASA